MWLKSLYKIFKDSYDFLLGMLLVCAGCGLSRLFPNSPAMTLTSVVIIFMGIFVMLSAILKKMGWND